MNLLPKSSKEFGSVDYWEKFFQQRGKKAFEWYGTYLELCGVLHKYMKPREKVLVIGCGNSELSEQLYDVGYQDIVNIDISEVVIKQMKERNANRRPQMSFLKMDMTQMEFLDASFQVVLDKGTLDAVLTDEEEKTVQQVDRMLAEVGRVLQVPFLSVGGDIGVRTIQHQDCSPLSGDYVIEDVQGDDKCYFRRLIFLSNRNVVQSEARLLKAVSHKAQKKRKKDRKKQWPAGTPEEPPAAPGQSIDKSYLCCEHHKAMIAGLALLRNPELLLARPQYDVIMFDVDSKDPTLGMSCPPPAFVDQPFLQKVKSILSPEGVFILNLVCRDLGLKDSVLGGLKAVFPLLYVRRIEGEVNEILFCQLHPERKLATPELLDMAQALEQTLRKPGRGWDGTYVLSDMLKTVKIV